VPGPTGSEQRFRHGKRSKGVFYLQHLQVQRGNDYSELTGFCPQKAVFSREKYLFNAGE
jgi:hypothetical protein